MTMGRVTVFRTYTPQGNSKYIEHKLQQNGPSQQTPPLSPKRCFAKRCHGTNGPSKIGSPQNQFFDKYGPPRTYFTAKYGLPLKNLDHLSEMNSCRHETYFACKIWTSGICRGVLKFLRFLETTWACQFTMYFSLIPGRTQQFPRT